MRIDVLGWTTVTSRHGEVIALTGERPRLLLALLACRGNRSSSTDMLIEGLWGENPPRSSAANLQTYIWRIRQVLSRAAPQAADRLVYQSGSYGLRLEPAESDVYELAELHAAARRHVRDGRLVEAIELFDRGCVLWRGRPFSPAAAGRSATIAGEMRRCEELYVQICEDHALARLRCGSGGEMVPVLRRLVAEFPLRERLHVVLVRALSAAGDGGAALAAYADARAVFARELGTEPGPELRALHRLLLCGHSGEEPPSHV